MATEAPAAGALRPAPGPPRRAISAFSSASMASDSARSRGRSPSLLTAAMLAPWLRRYLGRQGRAAVRTEGSGPHAQRAAHPPRLTWQCPGNRRRRPRVGASSPHCPPGSPWRPAPPESAPPQGFRRCRPGGVWQGGHPHHPGPLCVPGKAGPCQGLKGDPGPTGQGSGGRPQGSWKAPCPRDPPSPAQPGFPVATPGRPLGLTGDRERRSWPERRGAVGILNHACSRDAPQSPRRMGPQS